MIRFAAMEILFAIFAVLAIYFTCKFGRKPIKKAIDDVKTEYYRLDEDEEIKSEKGDK